MKGKVGWIEGGKFLAESGTGHALPMQAKILGDEVSTAPSPMEYVLLGTGGCSCVDVVHILKKGRHDVRDCHVLLNADRAAEDPKVFTRIHMHFVVTGKGLKQEAVGRAVELSAEKYCSASIMLAKTATITHDFEVKEAE
ncbi:OsmC family protein [Dongia deserti]|uniref:OsmC family protein n=1 Tax=Dongia deserti TaxID=2268030 RepID=UPI000E6465BB|nr:OsmC family protein [Dongia deserti]